MDARSVWSGGVKWGSGTPSGSVRTNGYWLPDGATPSGRVFIDAAIGGTLQTDNLMSASWTLGIPDFMADLGPNTASLSFKGQVTGTPGDDVVISTGLGVQWSGRLDTCQQTRDTAGDWWTTISATDRLGGLGNAELYDFSIVNLWSFAEWATATVDQTGVPLYVVDDSVSGMGDVGNITAETVYTGQALVLLNRIAKAGNLMVAMTRDGRLSVVVRESVTPSSVLTLTGVNGPKTWDLSYSIDVDINKWYWRPSIVLIGADEADIALYGTRTYPSDDIFVAAFSTIFDDWVAYGGSQRPTASATMVVSAWSQDDLILLDPFQWVTESGTNWQVMSVSHRVSASPQSWEVSVTLDNLLDLL